MHEYFQTESPKFGAPSIGTPAELLFNREVSPTEKQIFGFIQNLSQSSKGCYATNAYLANLLGLNPQTITNAVSKLKKYKYITVETEIKNAVSIRRIFINPEYPKLYLGLVKYVHDCLENREMIDERVLKKLYPPIRENIPPYKETYNKDINKDINKDMNESKDSYKRFSAKNVPTKEINSRKRRRKQSTEKSPQKMSDKIKQKKQKQTSVKQKKQTSVQYEDNINKQLISLWNKQENLRTHKISVTSKTYKNALKKLHLLRTGKIHSVIDFNNSRTDSIPKELFSKKFTKIEIAKAIKNLNDWCKEGNYPAKKDWIKNLSLADAIFCAQYGSPLLCAFHKGVTPINDPVSKLKTEQEIILYNKLIEFFAIIKGKNALTLKLKQQIVDLLCSVKGLREQHSGNWSRFDPEMFGWGRTPNDTYSLIIDYLLFLQGKEFPTDFAPNQNLTPSGLKVGNFVWKKFEKAYRDKYGADVISGPM